ncbi:hypothetical protein GCM10009093_11920 [Brevundimonas terrae]|uniref:Uncharacterized protein n=1 Tax=Brevundimonas terrae TaxID=363631 RepID=A0ABP3I239_9CAUL|nr:hypothetical protein [Brevundimonas terrae]
MRILNAVIVSQPTGTTKMPQFQLIKRRSVGRQPICCDAFDLDRLIAQKTSEQLQSRPCIPPTLDNDV